MLEVPLKWLRIYSKSSLSVLISSLLLIVYSAGFLIWNYYLSNFGYFEYNFIQLRYLSAGLLFCATLLPLFITLYICRNFNCKKIFYYLFIFIYILTAIKCFIYIIFPLTPQYFGGGLPMSVSIIGNAEQIAFLGNFINTEDNAGRQRVQTAPLCMVYQNDDYVIFFYANESWASTTPPEKRTPSDLELNIRVLTLSRGAFTGFQLATDVRSSFQCLLSTGLNNGVAKIPPEVMSAYIGVSK